MVKLKATVMADSWVPEMADWMEASLGYHLEQRWGIEMAGYQVLAMAGYLAADSGSLMA